MPLMRLIVRHSGTDWIVQANGKALTTRKTKKAALDFAKELAPSLVCRLFSRVKVVAYSSGAPPVPKVVMETGEE